MWSYKGPNLKEHKTTKKTDCLETIAAEATSEQNILSVKKTKVNKRITIFLLLLSTNLIAQKQTAQIEITPYVRKDWYPEFSYAINSIDTNHVKLQGVSLGISAAYKIPLQNSVFLKLGTGFYRYTFNQISKINRFGENSRRHINYPSVLGIPFLTDKYWYNCVSLKVGAEKLFQLNNNWQITTGINIDNYFTFSQGYHITYNNPDNPIMNPYKLKKKRFFGFSGNLNAGALKQVGRITVGPSLILPIFDSWSQDEVFPQENDSETRRKWLRGFGVGITCNYLLNKQKRT